VYTVDTFVRAVQVTKSSQCYHQCFSLLVCYNQNMFENKMEGFDRTAQSEAVIDELADSRVSVVEAGNESVVKKLYTGANQVLLEDGFDAEVLKRYLETYIDDCKYVHQLETDNPELFTFQLSDSSAVVFHVVPQGESLAEEQGTCAVTGQALVEGDNLRDALRPENLSQQLYELGPEIQKTLIEFSDRINDEFPQHTRSYVVTEPNVKIETQGDTLHVHVTDLADSLTRSIDQDVIWPKDAE